MKFLPVLALPLALAGLLTLVEGSASAQAIGFAPGVGALPDGVMLNVTPAVSADRRYVRLALGFGSQTVSGFNTFPVVGAVGGGGNGQMAGGMGGMGGGGLGGLAGGFHGGGLRSIGVGPTDFAAWYPDLGVPRDILRKPVSDPVRSRKPWEEPSIVPIARKKPDEARPDAKLIKGKR